MKTIRTLEVSWVDSEGRETKKEVLRSGGEKGIKYFILEQFQIIMSLKK